MHRLPSTATSSQGSSAPEKGGQTNYTQTRGGTRVRDPGRIRSLQETRGRSRFFRRGPGSPGVPVDGTPCPPRKKCPCHAHASDACLPCPLLRCQTQPKSWSTKMGDISRRQSQRLLDRAVVPVVPISHQPNRRHTALPTADRSHRCHQPGSRHIRKPSSMIGRRNGRCPP